MKNVITAQEEILNITGEIFEAQKASNDEYGHRLKMLSERYKVHNAEYEFWESKLAIYEGRPPKGFDFMPPLPPISLRVK